MDTLSKHDKTVLDVMFDPLGTRATMERDYDDDETEDYSSSDSVKLPEDVAEIVFQAIKASEDQRFDESLRLFEIAMLRAPKSAAVLNDRAQALRLVGRDDDALEDLNLSLELSGGHGKTGIRSLCQRGILYRCAGRLDDARRDFEIAARGGSKFARKQLVSINPYAAMCNAMLRDISSAESSSFVNN